MAGRVRRARYERAEAITAQQAIRDLQFLTKTGLLEAVGQTKARHYVAGPRFPERVRSIAHQRYQPVDPYEA